MTYYREATVHTQELLDLLVTCENKIQTVGGAPGPRSCPAGGQGPARHPRGWAPTPVHQCALRGSTRPAPTLLPPCPPLPAGDMHGEPDDGYPVLPHPGFAPFVFMLQRHVPWADERLRGSYYHRAWQALAARATGLQHTVQPNDEWNSEDLDSEEDDDED
jgi:hypothetical protein